MSFQDISIERRQPIIDKRFIKIPGAEPGSTQWNEQPLLPVDEAISGLNQTDGSRAQTLNFGIGKERRDILPQYEVNRNLDFVTYARVGLDVYPLGTEEIDDIQGNLRDISAARNLLLKS